MSSSSKQPAVVVTGASGFIGRSVCRALQARGARVVAARRDHRAPFFDPAIETIPLGGMAAFAGNVCLHLAGNNNAQDIQNHYAENLEEERRLAQAIKACGFKKIVFASSALVYAWGADMVQFEDSPLRPASAYGKFKVELESLFSPEQDVIARIANVYGPGMSPDNVFSHVMSQLKDGPRVVVRDLTSIRDYIFISDVASALAELALGAAAGAFNISTGEPCSVGNLIEALARALGKPNVSASASNERYATSFLVLSPAKLSRTLGWKAAVSLQEGLRELVGTPAR